MAALAFSVQPGAGQFVVHPVKGISERQALLAILKMWKKVNERYLKQSEVAKWRCISTRTISCHFDDSMLLRDTVSVSGTIEDEIVHPGEFTRFVEVREGSKIQAVAQYYLFKESLFICALLSAPDNLRWSAQVKREGARSKGAGTAAFLYVRDLGKELGKKKIEVCPLQEAIPFYERLGMRWEVKKKVMVLEL